MVFSAIPGLLKVCEKLGMVLHRVDQDECGELFHLTLNLA